VSIGCDPKKGDLVTCLRALPVATLLGASMTSANQEETNGRQEVCHREGRHSIRGIHQLLTGNMPDIQGEVPFYPVRILLHSLPPYASTCCLIIPLGAADDY
jgi:hypothetical protein